MRRYSARYVDTIESVSLPETVKWLQQSNFLNRSHETAVTESNQMVAVEDDIQTSQVETTHSHSFPSSLGPFPEMTLTEHGFAGKFMDSDEEERRVLLAITVEVEDGHLEYIEVRDGDSAEAAATQFCQTHLLPEKYVAPLTEHIVQEVRRISKVDKSIKFASQDGMVHTNEAGKKHISEEKNVQNTEKLWTSHEELEHSFESDRELRSSKDNLNRGNHERKISKALSESLLSPTFTSLAKTQTNHQSGKHKESRRSKQISERAKTVYMRLYGEFLRQKQRIEEEKRWCQEQYKERIERDKPAFSKKTRRIMRLRGRASKQFRNYGELLYQEGLNKEEERQMIIQRKQQEDEAKELRLLTLKPEISKLAKQIKRDEGPVWDRLLNEKSRNDLQGLRQEVWEAKFMECTFRPRINPQPPDEGDLRHSRFDQLFWDAQNRRRRQAEYVQWYPEGVTFRPIINRYYKSSGNIVEDGRYREGSVFERLLQYATKLTEKKKQMQGGCSKLVDLSTGQELFRPQTGRKPLAERNTAALPIGDFLYQQTFELESKKKSLAAKDRKQRKELANGHYVGQKSQQLLNRLRERKVNELFEHLDKDRDGFVDLDSIDLKQLPEEMAFDISEMKRMGCMNGKHLSCSEFLELMDQVQKKAKPTPCLDQRCNKKTHHESEKFTFQFKMDRYSRSLANRKRRFSTRHQWYKIILLDRAKWQAKVESLRKEKQKQELAECTFRPAIHSSSSRGHIKLSDGTNNSANSLGESQNVNIVEKELREVHGFIFQEAAVEKSDSLEKPNGESPLGLLQSFKNMVRKSVQSNGELKTDDLSADTTAEI